jgi:hypothetical protein
MRRFEFDDDIAICLQGAGQQARGQLRRGVVNIVLAAGDVERAVSLARTTGGESA